MNIDSDIKIDDLDLIKYLKQVDSPFVSTISKVYEEIKDLLDSRIQHVFPNYTLHNSGHSFRIIQYMAKLVEDYKKLSELEITLLILSALLHDVGMAVSAEDVVLIESDKFNFCPTKFSAMLKIVPDKQMALQEYVRRIHASLSGRFIKNNLSDKLTIPGMSLLKFSNELALICESHTQDFDWIKRNLRVNEIKGDYSFNPQFIACILRLADIIDIDSNRTPYKLYEAIAPAGLSDEEWKQHFIISNNEKIVLDEKAGQKKIVFHGKSNNASTHRKLLYYLEWVKNELINVVSLANGMSRQYNLIYSTNPEISIQTEGYTFSDYKMTLNFRAISSLLMGENIYGSSQLGLRELIQNSIDSCRIRSEVESSIAEFGSDGFKPKIKVILDKVRDEVIIKDNGTGMTVDVIKHHFLNIGVSYYKSTDFLLKDFDYKPIGNFGIGFLACFMLSPSVKVITRHYQSKSKYTIELEQGNEWISLTEGDDVVFEGTEVYLSYKHFLDTFSNDEASISEFLKKYFLTDGIEVQVINRPEKKIDNIVNEIEAYKVSNPTELIIDVSKYIENATGYVSIKRRSGFIKGLEDIDFSGDLYHYTSRDGLQLLDNPEDFLISDYISNGKLSYYSIPLVPPKIEDDFAIGLRFTNDDINDVIEKLDRELQWICVLVPAEHQENIIDQDISYTDYLFGEIGHDDLVAIGHSYKCSTRAFVVSNNLYEHAKNNLYLNYHANIERVNRFYFSTEQERLFLRGVLVENFTFVIPTIASAFVVDAICINLNSRKFIPDISRNNINPNAQQEINYIVGKAIHLGAIDLLDLTSYQKQALVNFVKYHYNFITSHEK
jgi:molecular chaperone HtpG